MAGVDDAAAVPVPAEGDVVKWATLQQDGTVQALQVALRTWTKALETHLEQLGLRVTTLHGDLGNLEQRTSAAVVEGAGQVREAQQAVVQTARAADEAIRRIDTTMEQVVAGAQVKFDEQEAALQGTINGARVEFQQIKAEMAGRGATSSTPTVAAAPMTAVAPTTSELRGPPGLGTSGAWKIDVKEASNITKLGVDPVKRYPTWKSKLVDLVTDTGARKGVRELLEWAEAQEEPITEQREAMAQRGALEVPVVELSRLVHKGISTTIDDVIYNSWQKTAGEGRGLEFWRILKREYAFRSAKVNAAIMKAWMDPVKCKNIGELRARLPQWKVMTGEMEGMGKVSMPDEMKVQALLKFLPADLEEYVNNALELETYAQIMKFVDVKVCNDRGTEFAGQEFAGGPAPMEVNRLGALSTGEGEKAEDSKEVDPIRTMLSMMESTNQMLAMIKGGGKGGKGGGGKGDRPYQGYGGQNYNGNWGSRKAEPGKGGGKGGGGFGGGGKGDGWGSQGGGKGQGRFPGNCHFCGKQGHKLSECREKTKDMQRRGLNGLDEDWPEEDEEQGEEGGQPKDPWHIGSLERKEKAPYQGVWQELLAEDEDEEEEEVSTIIAGVEKLVSDMKCGKCIDGGGSWPTAKQTAACGCGTERGKTKLKMPKWTKKRCVGSLERTSLAVEKREVPIQALKKQYRKGRVIEVTVDSGAGESVTPEGFVKVPVIKGEAAKQGVTYTAANGGEVPNLGEQSWEIKTREGDHGHLKFQVAKVMKPLLAVSQITALGNRVHFYETWGEIVCGKTGKKTRFERKNGVYVLRVWVKEAADDEAGNVGFARPE